MATPSDCRQLAGETSAGLRSYVLPSAMFSTVARLQAATRRAFRLVWYRRSANASFNSIPSPPSSRRVDPGWRGGTRGNFRRLRTCSSESIPPRSRGIHSRPVDWVRARHAKVASVSLAVTLQQCMCPHVLVRDMVSLGSRDREDCSVTAVSRKLSSRPAPKTGTGGDAHPACSVHRSRQSVFSLVLSCLACRVRA